jgi:hypothetical protein
MKRTRIMGLCLVAVCAVFAVATTSAFATENLPHYGKCVKGAAGSGPFSNAGCTKLAKVVEKELYTWVPLTTTVKFTSLKKKETGPAVLEGSSGSEISCTVQKQNKEGEYGPGGDEVKNVVGEFQNCETSGFKCKSAGQTEGNIDTFKLHGEPGIVTKVLKEEKNVDGNDLRGQTGPELAAFTCGPVTVKVTGGVVVKAASKGIIKTNKMLNKLEVEFIAEKPGKQVPENWTPNGSGVSNSKHEEINEHLFGDIGKGPEPSGQSLITIQKTVGAVKVELRQCEKNISCPN